MKSPSLSSFALAILLAASSGGAAAQGFGSVSSGQRLPEDPVSAQLEAPGTAPAAAANPIVTEPAPAVAAAEANSFTTEPVPAAAAAEVNPFLTGSAAAAAAAAANPFLTGSAAAAVAAEANAFTMGSAPAVATAEPNPPIFAPVAGDAAPTGSGPETTVPFGTPDGTASAPAIESADRVLVKKSERRLYLLRSDRIIADYPVKLGLTPKGPKQREGDFRTPEGLYSIAGRNAHSEYFLSLEVSYPNEADLQRARELGVRPGGLIMIHGQPNAPRKARHWYESNDWTDGCIAVANSDMVDIWLRTPVGIPIEIRP
jgi:hypothetical protein